VPDRSEELAADFWFDPSCPYTWVTARWLMEVERVRPVELRWHVMSLSVLNEGRADDPEGDPEGYLWVPVRVCAAVRERYGQPALRRFYTALWDRGRASETEPEPETAREPDRDPAEAPEPEPAGAPGSDGAGERGHHDEREWMAPLSEALTVAGLPPDLAEIGTSTEYDDAVRASHAAGIGLVGDHVGTPIVAVGRGGEERGRVAFFGPVISRTPAGEEAGRLWDGTLLVAGVPGFHTLKGRPYAPPRL
jgi:hypothetical protein